MEISPATITDLENRSLRPLSDVEIGWAETTLEDAFAQIVREVSSVAARLDDTPADDTFRRLVVQVQCAMVLRVLRNPDGVLEQTIDDYRRRLDAAVSTGALYLTDAERRLLSATSESTLSSGAFTINPFAGLRRTPPDPWEPYIP